MLNIYKTGQKRDLEEDDLYTTLNDHSSSVLGNELEKLVFKSIIIMFVYIYICVKFCYIFLIKKMEIRNSECI